MRKGLTVLPEKFVLLPNYVLTLIVLVSPTLLAGRYGTSGISGKLKMRRTIYFYILILFFSTKVLANEDAQTFEFSFFCEVLDQQLLGVTDGKSERYSGFQDGSIIGDTFTLDFRYVEVVDAQGYALSISSDHKELEFGILILDYGFKEINDATGVFLWEDTGGFMTRLSKSIINITGLDGSQITGRRFYKNDWNLMLQTGVFDEVFIQTAKCMNVSDELDIVLDRIRAEHK